MIRRFFSAHWLVAAAFAVSAQGLHAEGAALYKVPSGEELTGIITALDQRHFEAFNRCDMDTLASLYAPSVEFYHDLNGKVLDREQLLTAIRKNICGKVQRRSTAPIEVQQLAGLGAIEIGSQCFYRVAHEACEQEGRFFMLWRFDGASWQLTRVFSYGHKNLP